MRVCSELKCFSFFVCYFSIRLVQILSESRLERCGKSTKSVCFSIHSCHPRYLKLQMNGCWMCFNIKWSEDVSMMIIIIRMFSVQCLGRLIDAQNFIFFSLLSEIKANGMASIQFSATWPRHHETDVWKKWMERANQKEINFRSFVRWLITFAMRI